MLVGDLTKCLKIAELEGNKGNINQWIFVANINYFVIVFLIIVLLELNHGTHIVIVAHSHIVNKSANTKLWVLVDIHTVIGISVQKLLVG